MKSKTAHLIAEFGLAGALEVARHGDDELNAAVYEALGYKLRWRTFNMEMFSGWREAARPVVEAHPAMTGFHAHCGSFARNVHGLSVLADRAFGFFKSLACFRGHGFTVDCGSDGAIRATITGPGGVGSWSATGSNEALALCACMCRAAEEILAPGA